MAIPLLLLSTACTSYGSARPVDAIPMPVSEEKRFEVWSGGESWQLHALRVDGDTLRGVRWWHDPNCDSCQVAIAKSAVDSILVPNFDSGKTGALSLIVLPVIFMTMVAMILLGGGMENY